jgi:two-component system alkaline phosphatase synthesis response regulator PhoP
MGGAGARVRRGIALAPANWKVMNARVLVVDDDPSVRLMTARLLEMEGYQVYTAESGQEGLEIALREDPHLLVTDICMPPPNGIDLCQTLRAQGRTIPIIFVSALESEADQVSGLMAGGDYYLTKPFSSAILRTTVRAALRRTAQYKEPETRSTVRVGEIEIDLERCEVQRSGKSVDVTASEFRLLAALVQAGGRVLSKDRLLEVLWDFAETEVGTRAVDMHISRLRAKLGHDLIVTVRGMGYRLAM